MALEPTQLLSKLFQWVFRSKQQLFDADTVAELMNVDPGEAGRALKSLAKEGKLDAHGESFSLHGAKIEAGSLPKAAPPAPVPMKHEPAGEGKANRRPSGQPSKQPVAAVAYEEEEEEIVEAPPAARPGKPAKSAPAPVAAAAPAPAKSSAPVAPAKAVDYPTLDVPAYTWVIDVADALVDYVQERNRPEVTVAALADFAGPDFADVYPDEQNLEARIFQLLEFFTSRGILSHGATPGTYNAHAVLVEREQSVAHKLDRMDVKRATKREYTIECAVPYTGLKGLAVMLYDGKSWLSDELHFPTPEGIPYIEVHHIHRVAQGGNESLENLCLLNPYHHKWCHFATEDAIAAMEAKLKGLAQEKLEGLLAAHLGSSKKSAGAAKPAGSTKKVAAKATAKPASKAAAKPAAKKPAPKVTAKVEPVPAKKAAAKKTAAKKTAAKPAARPAAKKSAVKSR